jgi:hypothetical protein
MSGNVVPETGPTMENVYDSMETGKAPTSSVVEQPIQLTTSDNVFHKTPNPQLIMYVYPHFAGKDGIPIPGYYTAFNGYEKDHYALSKERVRAEL